MTTTAQVTAREFATQFRSGDEVLVAGTYRRVLAAAPCTVFDRERRPQPAVQLTLGGGQRVAFATYRPAAPVTRRRG